MNDYSKSSRHGQRIGLAILILLCAGLVALAADEALSVHMARRGAQFSADAAAVAGAMRLAHAINGAKNAQDFERLLSDSTLAEA